MPCEWCGQPTDRPRFCGRQCAGSYSRSKRKTPHDREQLARNVRAQALAYAVAAIRKALPGWQDGDPISLKQIAMLYRMARERGYQSGWQAGAHGYKSVHWTKLAKQTDAETRH